MYNTQVAVIPYPDLGSSQVTQQSTRTSPYLLPRSAPNRQMLGQVCIKRLKVRLQSSQHDLSWLTLQDKETFSLYNFASLKPSDLVTNAYLLASSTHMVDSEATDIVQELQAPQYATVSWPSQDVNTLHQISPDHSLGDTIISKSHQEAKFRTEVRRIFICTFDGCEKEFGRRPELYRHHRNVHLKSTPFYCYDIACGRFVRGFPRSDKRNEHERKIHGYERRGHISGL